jgi:large subunit ribosomal protein L25
MDSVTLALDTRKVTGKAVKHLRKQGLVPAVIHDHGKASVVVQAPYQSVLKAYHAAGRHHPVEISAGGKKYTALIKSVTTDPKYNAITHVVFNAVKADEKVEAEIPVRPRYNEDNDATPAERASLIVLANLETVQVKALPKDLPDALEYDAEKLVEVGDHVTVADLIVPAGVEIETAPEHAVATVYEPSALQAANDAAGGDAEAEDAEAVESEHESTAEPDTQAAEQRPGGKKEFEDKSQGHEPEKQ